MSSPPKGGSSLLGKLRPGSSKKSTKDAANGGGLPEHSADGAGAPVDISDDGNGLMARTSSSIPEEEWKDEPGRPRCGFTTAGKGVHLLKVGSKRRRTAAELNEIKEADARKEGQAEAHER